MTSAEQTDEHSSLLPQRNDEGTKKSFDLLSRKTFMILLVSTIGSAVVFLWYFLPSFPSGESSKRQSYAFPPGFVWGVATSSYQVEGAVKEDGRGPSIWDTFTAVPGNILDGSDGSVACDHYHRVVEDVKLMKSLNVKAYRFSIAWPRIIPNGTGEMNSRGVAFYNMLIDTLLEHEIEPWVTLFHWDLPDPLYTQYGGWLDRDHTVEAFGQYARVCFQNFGDRVKRWITINEAWTVAVLGHAMGDHAPGHKSSTEPYIVAHNLILAHATAAHIYRTEFAAEQGGLVGISNPGDFRYPLTSSQNDKEAAERAILFQFGWITDPLFLGDYPHQMRERLGSRLPEFSEADRQLVLGSADFIGLNYYSSLQASTPSEKPSWEGYWADMEITFSSDPAWEKNDMGWDVVPDGIREMLLFISNRYNHPPIFVTENGTAEPEDDAATAIADEKRREFYEGHLRACAQAMENGNVNLLGYFAWSLMDNFEWQYGYQRRFGICRVDYDTLERTPKSSGEWYRDTIGSNGQSITRKPEVSWFPSN